MHYRKLHNSIIKCDYDILEIRLDVIHKFQYGKTAKFYVYAPGELDLNVLIGRCKEMPRKRDPEGKPQKFKMLPAQQMQQEAYSHAKTPKGILASSQELNYCSCPKLGPKFVIT